MKKRLVHDWPNCKTQNDELSEKIIDLADNYQEEFKKREHEKENDNLNDGNNSVNDFEMKQFSQGNKDGNFLLFFFYFVLNSFRFCSQK